jgi:hypothetical protein
MKGLFENEKTSNEICPVSGSNHSIVDVSDT